MDCAENLTLPRGACRMWHAAVGTELIATRGRLRIIEACRPVADLHTVSRTAMLDSGQPHRIGRAGWIRVTAVTDGELRVRAPAPMPRAAVGHALRRMITALRSVLAVARIRTF
jgi:hypothetical protein